MTSKISFNKLLRENIRQRGWLAALSWISFFLSVTLYSMLWTESSLSTHSFDKTDFSWIRYAFPGLLNGSASILLAILIFIFAILCAVTGFSYLHTPDSIDFYHSLPVSRTRWFLVSYTGGLLIFVIPYLTAGFCTILLTGVIHKFMNGALFITSCMALIGGTCAFLLIYHVTILAMMLTGKLVTGVLAALVLAVYGSMISGLLDSLESCFFAAYSGNSSLGTAAVTTFASPLMLFFQLIVHSALPVSDPRLIQAMNRNYVAFPFLLSRLGIAMTARQLLLAVITVGALTALFFASLFLYKKRHSEAALHALSYPRTAPFIKILVAVPTALFMGLCVNSMFGNGRKWVIIISIISAILLCGITEFIYNMDLKKLLSRKYSSLISVLGVIGILCIFQFDLFGYDRWLPKETELESMAFTASPLANYVYFTYPENADPNSTYFELLDQDSNQMTDFAPLYELAQEGVRYTAEMSDGSDAVSSQIYDLKYTNVTIRFNKKSGGTVYRSYKVTKDSCMKALSALSTDESYRKALFPIFYVNENEIQNIRLADIYTTEDAETLNLSPTQMSDLLDAYKQDVLEIDIHKLQDTFPFGELFLEIPDPSAQEYASSNGTDYAYQLLSQFYLYEDYKNTLSLLEEYGYPVRTKVQSADVAEMKLIETDETVNSHGYVFEDKEENKETVITNPAEIEKILSQLEYSYSTRILGTEYNPSLFAEITFTENRGTMLYPISQETF